MTVAHSCHAEPGWYCDGGDEYGPCAEVRPADECIDPECNTYVGRCGCACHTAEEQR